MYEDRHTAGVLPSVSAVSFSGDHPPFQEAGVSAESTPMRANAQAQVIVPAHVRKSFALNAPPMLP
jgi:hypothetical protein